MAFINFNFSVWIFSFMDWRCVDERLIGRGDFLLSLDFLGDYEFEFSLLNESKLGGV